MHLDKRRLGVVVLCHVLGMHPQPIGHFRLIQLRNGSGQQGAIHPNAGGQFAHLIQCLLTAPTHREAHDKRAHLAATAGLLHRQAHDFQQTASVIQA